MIDHLGGESDRTTLEARHRRSEFLFDDYLAPTQETLLPARRHPFELEHFGLNNEFIVGLSRSDESSSDVGHNDHHSVVHHPLEREAGLTEKFDPGRLEVLNVDRVVDMAVGV